MENKDKICELLAFVLMNTREYSTLSTLIYNEVDEVVTAVFPSRWIEINVAMDSGIAMVRDILKVLQEEY